MDISTETPKIVPLETSPTDIAITDINNDGNIDIITADSQGSIFHPIWAR